MVFRSWLLGFWTRQKPTSSRPGLGPRAAGRRVRVVSVNS